MARTGRQGLTSGLLHTGVSNAEPDLHHGQMFGGSLTRHIMVKAYSRSRSLATLHSCHSQFVLLVRKDVHGPMLIRQHVPFEGKRKRKLLVFLAAAGAELNYDPYLSH